MKQIGQVEGQAASRRDPVGSTRMIRSIRSAELLAADIRRRILERDLLENDALPPESELMAQYGVSRPTLREALCLLEAEKLIVVRRGGKGGAVIQQPNLGGAARQFGFVLNYRGVSLGDVHCARMLVEPPALANLALTATSEQIADLRQQLSDAAALIGDEHQHRVSLSAIREKMVELTGMITTTMIMHMLQEVIEHQTTGFPTDRSAKFQKLSQKAHEHMLQIVATGNVENASSYWRGHLLQVERHCGPRNTKQLFNSRT